jgi:beta-lactamase regulating signal transducer with metallopeptidase domain
LPLPDAAGQLALLLLRATLLIGAAWAAATALRKAGAPAAARHMAWLFGIAALLALPILRWLVPALGLPILPAEAATAAAASSPASAPPPFVPGGPISPEVPIAADWGLVLAMAYALGAAILLMRLVVGRRMLARLWSDAGTVTDPAWERLLARLSSDMLLPRPVELRIARGPAVPMTWGTLAPKVLLPAEAWGWSPERRRLVLLHELAHVARRDSLSRSLASLACALYWFHPGAWLAARRMRMEQEHAADDRVLMAGGSPQAYALSLLHLARGPGARPQFDQAAAMAGMYQLERRLVSITSGSRRNRPGALFLSSSALLAGLTTLFVAAGVPVSATPTLPGPFRANGSDMGPPIGKVVNSGGSEESSARPEGAERASSGPAGPELPSVGPAAEPVQIAELRPGRPAGTVPSESEPKDSGGESRAVQGQSPANAQPLRNYGWELPRPGSPVQTGASASTSDPDRIALQAPVYTASSDRAGPPKWIRGGPRLVRGRPPVGSHPSAQGPLVLSWSLEVGGK